MHSAFGACNLLKLFQTPNPGFVRHSCNSLVIPKSVSGVIRLPQIEVIGRINNLVPESHEVNQLSLSESDNLPTIGWLVDRATDSYSVPGSSTNGVWAKKKGGISDPTPWLAGYRQIWRLVGKARIRALGDKGRILLFNHRQTTENPAVHSVTGSNPAQPKRKRGI